MTMWISRAFGLLVMLPGLLFIVLGLRWLVDPAGVAPTLGLSLQTGLGLSSQIGDFSGFFLVAGLSILIGVVTRNRTWFYPPAMLLLLAATGRLVAWIAHGASFAFQQIIFEVVVAAVLLIASRYLSSPD